MLINNEQANIVTKLAVTMFAAAPGGFKGYLDNLAVSKAYNMEDIAVALSSEPGFTAMYSGTTAQKVATMSKNLSLDVLDAGIRQVAEDFLTAQIDAGVNLGKLYSDALSYMLTDTNFALAASTIDKKVAVANSFTSGYGKDVYSLDTLQSQIANVTANTDITAYVTKYLTVAQDVIFGDASNNLFVANLSADKSTLQSGDYINGGAGVDTLTATLVDTPFAITPETDSVEILQVRSQSASGTADGDNEIPDGQNTIDAQNMRGTEQFWSVDSRADLVIEDVRHDSNLTTIGFRNADAGDVDYAVYFNSQNIKAPGAVTEGSQLFLELLDLNSMRDGTGPLTNNPYSGVKIAVGGVEVVIAGPTAFTTTYADMVTALNNALDQLGYTNIRAAEGDAFTAINSTNGQSYTGTKVVLTNSGAEQLEAKGWVTPDGSLPPATNIHTKMDDTQPSTTPALTQTNIELDNVGQASMSGDMLVGNMSTGTSGSKGIEQFNVVVDRSSWIKTLATTNNGLEVVNVQNKGANGNLRIDNTSLTDGQYGLTDVRVVDASKMTGNVTLSAVLNDDVTAKFMNLKDTAANPAADNSDIAYRNVVDTFFSYDMGAGNDNLLLDISSQNLANAGTTTREDFVLDINGNAGNDNIELRIVDEGTQTLSSSDDVWYGNHKINANITVNGGEGNNTIKTTGAGDVKINTGSGNDTIYTDNAGNKSKWVFNTADQAAANANARNIDNLQSAAHQSSNLYKGQLTVAYTDDKGGIFSKTITIDTTGFTTSKLQINQAIKKAIQDDNTLSKLLTAEDGPSGTLVVTSLVDGNVTDLTVTLARPTQATLTYDQAVQWAASLNDGGAATTAVTGIGSANWTAANAAAVDAVINANMTDPTLAATYGDGAGNHAYATAYAQTGANATAEVQTFDFTGITLESGNAITFTLGGQTFQYINSVVPAAQQNAGDIVASIGGGVGGQVHAIGAAGNYVFTVDPGNANKLVITQQVGNFSPIAQIEVGAQAREVQNVDFTGLTVAAAGAGDITVGGITVTLANDDTPAQIATKVAAALDGTNAFGTGNNVTVTVDGVNANSVNIVANTLDLGVNTITPVAVTDAGATFLGPVTAAATAVVTEVQNGGVVAHGAAVTTTDGWAGSLTNMVGTDSTYASDNTINAGAGTDVIVLGTDDTGAAATTSTDTVVFTGTFGNNTIVNFVDGNGAGYDIVDFTAYLGGAAAGAGVTAAPVGGLTDKQVAVTDFAANVGIGGPITVGGTTVTWSNVETYLKDLLNDTANAIAGNDFEAWAVAAGVTTATKNVMLLENNANAGEYKVFALESAANTAGFSTVSFVGIVDFGAAQTLVDENLA